MTEAVGVKQPEITLDMRVSARSNPNSWLYVIDPAFGPDADVPPWGVVGAYPVDDQGEIVERFRFNGEYRPSPSALRLPVTSNPLEKVLQLVYTRHRRQADLLPAVLDATLLVYARGGDDRAVTGFRNHDGRVMVPVCTSAAHVPGSWPGWREVVGRDLAGQLRGFPVVVNPLGPLTAVIPAADLCRGLVVGSGDGGARSGPRGGADEGRGVAGRRVADGVAVR